MQLMDKYARLQKFITENTGKIGKVVDFDPQADCLYPFDFTAANNELSADTVANTSQFNTWVSQKLYDNNCRYGIGGYMEHRTLYARSELFNADDEPRRLHLGVDIWADAGTPVYAPIAGTIHSFRDNNNHGDYGPTIILMHQLGDLQLYTLYGHLSRRDLVDLHAGDKIEKGQQLGTFGNVDENGHWPPHLHFQLMFDMGGNYGDYPGVGKFSEKEKHLANIPDPALILQFSGINMS